MKQSFKSTLKQTPSFSPQQQQAVKILQLNSTDLSQKIQQALESNPFLELLDNSEVESIHTRSELPKLGKAIPRPSGPPSLPGLKQQASDSKESVNNLEPISCAASSLKTFLHNQAANTPLSDRQHYAIEVLIDSVEDNGYLGSSLQELALYEANLSLAELESALQQLQTFEPVGVGCRDLSECLSIQLKNISRPSPTIELALIIVKDHLKELSKQNRKALCKALEVDALELQQAIDLITRLDPKPGAQIESTAAIYISADISVSKQNGCWYAELNREQFPQVRLSSYTQDWLDQIKEPSQKQPLLEQANTAKLLVSQIENRYQTTFRVATEIVKRQQAYFDHGNIALQPLGLKDIAQSLNLHISTVSRTVNGKYLRSNKGLKELKFFFSATIVGRNDQSVSARSVQATIEKMIREEVPNKPISDNTITQQLNEVGIQVARRTVAKYRETLKIPASSVRKHLSNPPGLHSRQ